MVELGPEPGGESHEPLLQAGQLEELVDSGSGDFRGTFDGRSRPGFRVAARDRSV